MQDEINEKTIALYIKTGKLTAQTLQKAMKKLLEQMKKQKGKAPQGKQTLKQLMKQNTGISNIEITEGNIKAFESTAKKYGIDFALKKDTTESPPRYLVFFKGRDADVLTAAFKEFSAKKLTQEKKPSIRKLLSDFAALDTSITESGKKGNTLVGIISSAYKKFGGWMLVTRSLMVMVNNFKQMVTNVRALDAAMTELKKVTDETRATYTRFFNEAAVRAKSLGATLTDTITATADFARLGYSISEAAELADAALVYKNVGDGINDISEASESVISTMKAFGIEAANVMTIVDRFNEGGNRFAISSKGVGDALVRSASALAAAGNSLDESIALVTAANNVVQDPEKVGTTMKTVSMYLRAAKTEAEEAGESTEGMAESVSKLRKEIVLHTNSGRWKYGREPCCSHRHISKKRHEKNYNRDQQNCQCVFTFCRQEQRTANRC